TYRVCQPLNWFLTLCTHTTLWGVLAVVATGGAPLGWLTLLTAQMFRLCSLRYTMHLLREWETPRQLWLVPLSDRACWVLWATSWMGRDVEWSGRRFHVHRDGRLVRIEAAPSAPAEPVRAPAPAVGLTTHARRPARLTPATVAEPPAPVARAR